MIKTAIFKKAGLSFGWLIVGVSALLMGGFWGSSGSFGVFLKPLISEFGWTRAVTSGAMSTVQIVYGFVAVIMGRLTDKYGARMILAFGAVVGVAGYILISHLNSTWQLYVFFGLLIGISIGTTWAPINATVSRWFVERRVLALGLINLGPAIGHMVLPPLSAWIIDGHGLSIAYSTLAGVVCVTAIPAVIALGKKPPHIEAGISGSSTGKAGEAAQSRQWSAGEAIRSSQLWMLIIFTFINSIVFFFFSVHIVAYATDAGIPATSAALLFTCFNGTSIAGIFLAWPISGKFGPRGALLLFLGIQAVVMFLFIRAESLWVFILLAIVFGFGFGGTNPIRAAIIPHIFGMKAIGSILGFIAFSWAIGGAVGPFAAAYIFDVSQSYTISFMSAGLLLLVAIAAISQLKEVDKTP
jgi:MFS family permease